MRGSDVILVLVTLLFPPATAAIITGCSCDLLINIALTCLGYLPGHLHGFWLIYRKAQAEERFGEGNYKYIGNGEFESFSGGSYSHIQPPLQQHAPPAYGSTTK